MLSFYSFRHFQCDFSEDEVSCCEKSFSHDSNDEDDLEENVEAQDGRLSGLNGTEVEDTASEGKRKEEDATHALKGESSPGPEIQDTAHLNGHVLHESGRISGMYLVIMIPTTTHMSYPEFCQCN